MLPNVNMEFLPDYLVNPKNPEFVPHCLIYIILHLPSKYLGKCPSDLPKTFQLCCKPSPTPWTSRERDARDCHVFIYANKRTYHGLYAFIAPPRPVAARRGQRRGEPGR
jgi:hypothetical protein